MMIFFCRTRRHFSESSGELTSSKIASIRYSQRLFGYQSNTYSHVVLVRISVKYISRSQRKMRIFTRKSHHVRPRIFITPLTRERTERLVIFSVISDHVIISSHIPSSSHFFFSSSNNSFCSRRYSSSCSCLSFSASSSHNFSRSFATSTSDQIPTLFLLATFSSASKSSEYINLNRLSIRA